MHSTWRKIKLLPGSATIDSVTWLSMEQAKVDATWRVNDVYWHAQFLDSKVCVTRGRCSHVFLFNWVATYRTVWSFYFHLSLLRLKMCLRHMACSWPCTKRMVDSNELEWLSLVADGFCCNKSPFLQDNQVNFV
jgi:hypothetical protein